MKLTSALEHMAGGLCLVAVASLSTVADAGQGAWTSGGPYGGSVMALTIDPTNPATVYAGTEGAGVFKSTDSGGTWTGKGPPKQHISALAVNPAAPATVYAGTLYYADGSYGRLYKSTDSGNTWASAITGIPLDYPVRALAIDPATPANVYVCLERGGVYKSTDSGGRWARSLVQPAYAVAIDPSTPATVYAGTNNGVFKSTDSGVTWTGTNTGLTNLTVSALAMNSRAPATLYAGTDGGIFKSTDSGSTWAAASNGLTDLSVTALAASPLTPATLYARTRMAGAVFKSTDSGASWAADAALAGLPVNVLSISATTPATLYAGTFLHGVFRSADSGATWAAASTGLTNLHVFALAANQKAPAALYAGTDGGLFKSTDFGGSWALANTGLPTYPDRVESLAIDPTTPATLYAGTLLHELFKSTDSGATWASTGLVTLGSVSALAINPITPSTVYAATIGYGLYKSTDSGATWTANDVGQVNKQVLALAIDPTSPAILYATTTSGGVSKSTDSGSTWTAANAGLPAPAVLNRVFSLAIDPSNPASLYAGVENGYVFKSRDSGSLWAGTALRGNGGYDYVPALAIDPRSPTTLYAGTMTSGVFRSSDSGGIWASIGLEDYVASLAIDPTGPTTLFAGLYGSSVWQITPATGGSTTTALLPSSARQTGLGGAVYTTDLTVANTGSTPTTFILKFLGNNADGRGGPERSFSIAAGSSRTFSDVLGSLFGQIAGFGAIRMTSPSDSLRFLSQTSTPGFGGSFGQSVPAARPEDLIAPGTSRSILGVREDASFRTNLMLANASEDPVDVDVTLVADTGSVLGSTTTFSLPPLGMTQVSRVARALGATGDVSGARLVVFTRSGGSGLAAYASAIDNVTNDPRTLLPQGPISSDRISPDYWIVPSCARASGAGGAFYTTDVTVAYMNDIAARYTLKFLGNNLDGRSGPEATFDLGALKSATYTDVLGSLFQRSSDFGAIRVASQYPSSDSRFIAVLAQTSTPGFGGTFGQSVPAATSADLIRFGAPQSILAVREDDAFRTNLILANAIEAPLDVDVQLVSADGVLLATKRYVLAPLGMTQVTKVVRDVGVSASVSGARLVVSTPTAGGALAAYASTIDNVTNDPRTLLPR